MAKRVDPKEVATWAALILGALVVLPWLRRITPAPTPTGAEETPCGTGPFTIDAQQARIICDGIEQAATGFTEDEDAIIDYLSQARTNGDVCRIIQTFGRRSVGTLFITYNLPQLVTEYLTTEERARINNNYAAKGITYRF